MNPTGRWEGKLIDASGVTSLVTMDVKEQSGEIEGQFEVYFLSPDRDGCCAPTRRLVQKGELQGKYDEQASSLVMSYGLELGGAPILVTFDGEIKGADPYALQALRGCYRVGKGSEQLGLEGGGGVLWQFATTPGREGDRG